MENITGGRARKAPVDVRDPAMDVYPPGAEKILSGIQKIPPDSDPKKLFVRGISWKIEPQDLESYFSKFGKVVDVVIKSGQNGGTYHRYAFVSFLSESDLLNVLDKRPHKIKGEAVDSLPAKKKPGMKAIFVGGLDIDCREKVIINHFEKYGKVVKLDLPFDYVKNQRRQFCFVTFESEDACEEASRQAKQKIGAMDCDVKKATCHHGGGGTKWISQAAARGPNWVGQTAARGAAAYPVPLAWREASQHSYVNSHSQVYGNYPGYGGYGNQWNYSDANRYSGVEGVYGPRYPAPQAWSPLWFQPHYDYRRYGNYCNEEGCGGYEMSPGYFVTPQREWRGHFPY